MQKNSSKKIFIWIIFIVYIVVTLYFLLFASELGRSVKKQYAYNLDLFKEITRYTKWAKVSKTGFKAMLINIVGNIACFIPFGILLPLNVDRTRSFISVSCITFIFSLSIENVQLITKLGSFDVDDLLLNTIGGAIGYITYIVLVKYRRKKRCLESRKNTSLQIKKDQKGE